MSKSLRVALVPLLFLTVNVVMPTPSVGQDFRSESQRQKQRQLRRQRYLHEHSDSTGKSRSDLLRKAIEQIKQMRISAGAPLLSGGLRSGAKSMTAAPLASGSSPITGVQWTQIGPAPLIIDTQQNFQGTGPDSGQVLDVVIDPRNSKDEVIYIATNDAGIWKSSDGGSTWAPTTDYMPSLWMGAVTLDPSNPSIVYAGTGGNFNNEGAFGQIGVYKSIDSGQTWLQLPATVFDGLNIIRMLVPSSNILLVATTSGLYRSKDGGLSFGSNSPLFNNNQPVLNGYITDLHVDTASSGTVYAAVSGSGIFKSTDSGATFTNLFTNSNGAPTGFKFLMFSQSTKPDNQTFYASVQASGNGFKGLYKSTDGGQNWAAAAAGGNPGNKCQCGYDQTVGVDPQDANRVYLGFQDLYLSTDGGGSFNIIGDNDIHDDIHAFFFSPSTHVTASPTPLYIGEDGGITRLNSDGSFTNLNGSSGSAAALATNTLRSIDIGRGSASNNVYTFGGAQDTGISQHSPGDALNDWHLHQDGDGGATVVDPSNPSNAYSSDDGIFQTTTTAGSGWSSAVSSNGLPDCGGNFKGSGCANPIAVDPNNSSNVYAAGADGKLYFSTDQGNTFKLMKDFSGNGGVSGGSMVQIDSNTLWVGLGDGSVQFTGNALSGASSTWHTTAAPATFGGQGVASIAVDPANTAQAVVVYPGFCAGACLVGAPSKHTFYTTNGGASWSDISPTIDAPLFTVVIDPSTSPHSVIVGSDAAVLRTANLGNTWQVYGVGLPTVLAGSLALDSTPSPALLRLGTYGRSAFELTAATGPLLAINANLAFGSVCIGQTSTLQIQLFNVGSTDLSIGGIVPTSTSSGDFQVVSGSATPVTIPPGEEIDFTIGFTPQSTEFGQSLFAVFQINSTDQFQPTKLVYASGTAGAPSINATIVNGGNFGNVCPGSQASLSLNVTNQSQCNLVISNITTSSNFLPPTTNLPLTLTADATISLPISFAPGVNQACSNSTALTGTVDVSSNDPVTPDLIESLQGLVPCPQINATIANSGKFGNVCAGTQGGLNLEIMNQGQCNLNVSSVTSSNPNFTVNAGTSYPLVLSANANVDLPLTFLPPAYGTAKYVTCSDTVAQTANIAVASNDPSTPNLVQSVNGIEGCPKLVLSPQNLTGIYAYPATVSDPTGNLGCYTDRQITASNSGICPLTIAGLTTANGADGAGNPLAPSPLEFTVVNPVTPVSVAPGAAPVPITIRFKPVILTGQNPYAPDQQTGTLSIVSNDPVPGDNGAGLCGEPTYSSGARVLVVDASGNPISSVSKITLASKGLTPKFSETLMPAPALAGGACGKAVLFHLDNETLKPAGTTGNNPLASYVLSAKNGPTSANMSFTLGQCQMQQIVLQIK